MKKAICFILGLLLITSMFTGCSSPKTNTEVTNASTASANPPEPSLSAPPDAEPTESGSRVLIVYYSHSGTTENVAKTLAGKTDADLYLLEPDTPYSDSTEAVGVEMQAERDNNAIRALKGTLPDLAG